MVLPHIDPFLGRLKRFGDVGRDELARFGTALFEALISRPFNDEFRASLDAVTGGPLSIAVSTDSPYVHAVPWEMMHDPVTGTFLGAAGGTRAVVRRVSAPAANRSFQAPLRILFVRCEVLDLPPLDLDREQDWLESAVGETGDELLVLTDVSRDQLLDALNEHQPHVLHFAGYDSHYASKFTRDEGIVLMDADGRRDFLEVPQIVQLLYGRPTLRLVITNTCFTASRLAPALVRAGVPSVIGMRYAVADDDAVQFTKTFYEQLHRLDHRVDLALAETRRTLYVHNKNEFRADWSYPSLCTSVTNADYFGDG